MKQTFKYIWTFIYQIYAKSDLREDLCETIRREIKILKSLLKMEEYTPQKSGTVHIHWFSPILRFWTSTGAETIQNFNILSVRKQGDQDKQETSGTTSPPTL